MVNLTFTLFRNKALKITIYVLQGKIIGKCSTYTGTVALQLVAGISRASLAHRKQHVIGTTYSFNASTRQQR